MNRISRWTLTGIANELQAEAKRFGRAFSTEQVDFAIRLGTISKALASLRAHGPQTVKVVMF